VPSSRTGLVIFWKGYERESALRAVELADEAGYDSFWVPEAWGYEAFSLLTEMAHRTRRIKLGTGIVNVFSRGAGLLAMSAATLSEISDGRFILGLGTSGRRLVEDFHRAAYRRPLSHMRETIITVRRLLRGERISEGPMENGAPVSFALGVRRRHEIPIYCGCLQPGAIEMVGELGDGWMPMFWSYHRIAEALAWLRRGAERAGRCVESITIAPFTAVVPSDNPHAEATVRRMIAFYVGAMGEQYHGALSRLGFADAADRVRMLWAENRWREAQAAVPDSVIEALTVTGDIGRCREQLALRHEYGIDLPILILPAAVRSEVVERYITTMAPGA
jgi:alkanesulfonate monooxygenase SsuD/methylene tetrahydromethanopterin reductase-like flavin-dependent oxidoreductase (luciferase family)